MKICENCKCLYKPTRGKQRFCCKSCCRGVNKHNYKGGSINWNGYRVLHVNGKRIFEHRYLLEQHLGRKLLRGEVVHHKNGDKLDNRIKNLELLSNQGDHVVKHCQSFQSVTHRQCTRCGKIKSRSQFDKGCKHARDPNHPHCKACRKAYYAHRYQQGLTSCQNKKQT